MKSYLLFFLLLISSFAFSQSMLINGTVEDTVLKSPLPYAVIMAVKLKDSTLVNFTRTDAKGFFSLANLPIDTYEVVISHPRFGDKTFYILGASDNFSFELGKFNLPPKSIQIKEVIIYAFKDPVYYKGDTLIYTADSFKVKPNATVEDLLKKLPGIKVDAQGNISAGGKKVDQVLVDGDEFFGSDPTIATRNLNADNIQSVQIYEKPNENSSGDGTDETQKVMNLKLKDEAKKGYFGKVSAGSDCNKFYETEALANRFNKKQKISLFGLGSNTPKSSIGWSDAYKYGLQSEQDYETDDDGNSYYYSSDGNNSGIPKVFKSGLYYTDKFGKNMKITGNYSYNSTQIKSLTETNSEYFLADTTYKTSYSSQTFSKTENHKINLNVAETLDSLTDLNISTKLTYTPSSDEDNSLNKFLTESDTLSRSTSVNNNYKSDRYNFSGSARLSRRFKKKDRLFTSYYTYSLNQNNSKGILKSSDYSYSLQSLTNSINQQKTTASNSQTHTFSSSYTEPLTKKIKLRFSYDLNFNISNQDKKSLDYLNGEYSGENSSLTNNFENRRTTNILSTAFIYEVKKQRLTLGSRVRSIDLKNTDLVTKTEFSKSLGNVLPFLYYYYSFSDNRRINLSYSTNSTPPSINQLQPVKDNTNPNYINLGNPDLLPSYKHTFDMYYYSYKAVTGGYFNANGSFSYVNNDVSNSYKYDSSGRTFTKPVNVNGNYNGYGSCRASFSFFSRVLSIEPSINFNFSKNTNFINDKENVSRNLGSNAELDVDISTDLFDISIGGKYNYSVPFSSVNSESNHPYSGQHYTSSVSIQITKKLKISSDADYTINQQRSQGYNIDYLIWNASVSKVFLKKENLIASFNANDILNQNINTYRNVNDNIITDTKTNTVARYFLLRLVYKFNSNKKKEENDDEF